MGEDATGEEDTDALGVSRGVPAVGDALTDDTGATAGADDRDALPVPVGMGVGLAVAVIVGVAVGVAVAVGRGVPAVGDKVTDDTGATAGADERDALLVPVGMGVGLAVGVAVGVAVGRGVPAVGDTVIDDTGVIEGAPVTTELGVTAENVTILTNLRSHRYKLPAVSIAIPLGKQNDTDVAFLPSLSYAFERHGLTGLMDRIMLLVPATVEMMPVLAVIFRIR